MRTDIRIPRIDMEFDWEIKLHNQFFDAWRVLYTAVFRHALRGLPWRFCSQALIPKTNALNDSWATLYPHKAPPRPLKRRSLARLPTSSTNSLCRPKSGAGTSKVPYFLHNLMCRITVEGFREIIPRAGIGEAFPQAGPSVDRGEP
jgi:hypothetical protein